jgi:hypothetical protein
VCKTYSTSNPFGLAARARQTSIPVKIISHGLQQHSNVGEPKRPNGAVSKKVEAKETQIVLSAQDSHVKAPQTNHLGTSEDLIRLTLVEFTEPQVQINEASTGFRTL